MSLTNALPLAFFDTNFSTPTILTTDASGYGISAVLSQKSPETGIEQPVYYLSRKLSDNEKAYSATEKEFLAVLWACERLHQYLYGRPFTIQTDHQCLKQLLQNGFAGGSAPCRVIRWSTKLLQYNYHVKYIPGKENYVADALSRVPLDTGNSHVELFSITLDEKEVSPLSLSELKDETACDDTLKLVSGKIKIGWPDKISKLPMQLQHFWNVRYELSLVDGVVMRNDKYVIPATLQDKIIAFAHDGHQGMSKTKSRIREFYWWPRLNANVESTIKKCPCCHGISRESPVQIPNYVHIPWHQVAIDIKGPIYDSMNRSHFVIVLVDCFSKFVATRVTGSVTTNHIILFLNSIFALFGHFTILTSDNGPQFISYSFKSYLRKRGIIHRRSAVYNPQSNGVAERVNKNITKLLDSIEIKNSFQLQEELDRYVMNYNSTQHATTGTAPSDLMFAYKMRTHLNLIGKETPSELIQSSVSERFARRTQEAADYANDRRRPMTTNTRFRVGDTIMTKQGRIRKIVAQVGRFSFKLDDGFCVNVRNILKTIPDSQPELVIRSRVVPANDVSEDEPASQSGLHSEDVSAYAESSSSTAPPSPRRSTRTRFTPRYLNDYIVDF